MRKLLASFNRAITAPGKMLLAPEIVQDTRQSVSAYVGWGVGTGVGSLVGVRDGAEVGLPVRAKEEKPGPQRERLANSGGQST
jgi:hypothetical protein